MIIMEEEMKKTTASYLISIIDHILYFWSFILLKWLGFSRSTSSGKVHYQDQITEKPLLKNKERVKGVRDIPGPFSLPVLGTTLTSVALKEANLQKSNEYRMKHYGPVVKEEHLWGFPIIHILDADLIEQAARSVGYIRPGMEILTYYRLQRPDRYDSVGLTNAQGDEWIKLHGAIHPVLTSPRIVRGIATASDQMAQDFVTFIHQRGPTIPDLRDPLRKFVTEVAFYNMFGTRIGFIQDDGDVPKHLLTFIQRSNRLWEALHASTYGLPWWKYFPTSLWQENKKCEDYLLDVIDDLIQTAISEGTTHGEGILGPILDCDQISYKSKRLLILEAILGSGDSVVSTLIFMLNAICRDKRVSHKLFEEIKTLLPEKDSELDVDQLTNLPYLKACIMECYRTCPIAPNFMRITERPLDLAGGYHIPPYTLVVLQWAYAATQEKSFYRPNEFLPERWIYNESDNKPPFHPHRRNIVYPFGMGKRSCPGARMVGLHIPILLARIIRRFEVTVDGPIEPSYVWIVQPADKVCMTFKDRLD